MLIKARRMLVLPEGEAFKQLTKTYESNLIPIPGMYVQDSMWHDQLEICEVVCQFKEDCYYILLPDLKINSPKSVEFEIETLSLHGWTVSP
ncbi:MULTISPECIES: hypothetical protein [unclassified Enterobacter cloacae complex]|jgi:hypothetical protein|uniref:hypothetical protein n=1 Tax=unclassified Enterobacter cloacae complex TaxID=2757714 RepID=UPI0018683868|nr:MULTISPECIES: hypothetical protein [unclassified Enterobacter cloacae complex]MBE3488377.1 hypothetical protein [Enterobacter cloacae complex sp. P8BA]MBE4826622.1 hypothetical protein [Enterobacter cloacae complex sp. S1]MBE4898931.1 hypothetical protein [Enterobacter cloacae complex sp. P8RS]